MRPTTTLLLLTAALLASGCPSGGHDYGHGATGSPEGAAKPTNRLPVPPAVRQNLGISFAAAEERAVTRTVRLPGTVAIRPTARRHIHARLRGTLSLEVTPLERVRKDQVIARVTTPALLEHQRELHHAETAASAAQLEVHVARAKLQEAQKGLAFLTRRIRRLGATGVRRAELETEQAALKRHIPVLKAELAQVRAVVPREEHHFELELETLAALTGIPVAELRAAEGAPVDDRHMERERWESIDTLEITADIDGVVTRILVSPGTWVEAGTLLLELADPDDVWVEARTLQSDLARLRPDVPARIVPASGGGEPMSGALTLGVEGDAARQSFPVFVQLEARRDWARPGVGVLVEAVVAGRDALEVAVPISAVVRDGLKHYVFRRDPANPDAVIRTEVSLGPDDGHWYAVLSGVAPGDEVVVTGAYELKLATSDQSRVSGHFHADGSFHEGED